MAKEKSKFNLKDQLAGIAALVAAIVAIGGGFVKYGEITTKLNALSEQTAPDLTPMAALIGENNKNIAVLQKELCAFTKYKSTCMLNTIS